MADPPRTLDGLPDELYDPILTCLPRSDLKNLRLTCKKLDSLAAPPLFHSVILLPFRACLGAFVSVLASTHLGPYVRDISYEAFWGASIRRLHERKDLTEEDNQTVLRARQDSLESRADLIEETALLVSIMEHLPNLERVKVREVGPGNIQRDEASPQYFRRLLNTPGLRENAMRFLWSRLERKTGATKSVLCAMTKVQANAWSFTSDSMDPASYLCDKKKSSLMDIRQYLDQTGGILDLTRLRHLSLVEERFRWGGTFASSIFVEVLKTAVSLQSLALTFTDSVSYRGRDKTNLTSDSHTIGGQVLNKLAQMGHHFPALKSLSLTGFFCFEADLFGFANLHKSTLRQLHLTEIAILRGTSNDQLPCLVRLLGRFRTLNLEAFSIEGYFNNSGNQCLDLSEIRCEIELCAPRKALKQEIFRWVTGKSTDMSGILKRVAIQDGQKDLVLSAKDQPGWKHDEMFHVVVPPSWSYRGLRNFDEFEDFLEWDDDDHESFEADDSTSDWI